MISSLFFFYGLALSFIINILNDRGYFGPTVRPYINNIMKNMIYIPIFLMIILLFVKIFINVFLEDGSFNNISNIYNWMSENNNDDNKNVNNTVESVINKDANVNEDKSVNNTVGNITDNAVNINHPNFNLSLDQGVCRTLTSIGSTAAGISAGVKLAQQFPTPAGKLLAVGSTTALAHVATIIGKKVLDTSSSSSNSKNYICNHISKNVEEYNINTELTNNVKNKISFEEYPMNLLPDVLTLINLEVLGMFLFLNTFLSSKLRESQFIYKYIPDNKFGKIIEILIKRYIKIWATSNNFVYILTWFNMMGCILLSKLCVTIILSQ
jgi:hypothetical protein